MFRGGLPSRQAVQRVWTWWCMSIQLCSGQWKGGLLLRWLWGRLSLPPEHISAQRILSAGLNDGPLSLLNNFIQVTRIWFTLTVSSLVHFVLIASHTFSLVLVFSLEYLLGVYYSVPSGTLHIFYDMSTEHDLFSFSLITVVTLCYMSFGNFSFC